MVSRHAARQSNVVWGGIKLCFRGNSQWQVTTVSHKVSPPHRDSLGCGAERGAAMQINLWSVKVTYKQSGSLLLNTQGSNTAVPFRVILPAFIWRVESWSCSSITRQGHMEKGINAVVQGSKSLLSAGIKEVVLSTDMSRAKCQQHCFIICSERSIGAFVIQFHSKWSTEKLIHFNTKWHCTIKLSQDAAFQDGRCKCSSSLHSFKELQ